MSALVAAVRARLVTRVQLTALVSTRLYQFGDVPPTVTPPYVTFFRVDDANRVRSLDGPSRLVQSRVQVDAWAVTAVQAGAVAVEVRIALDGFQGTSSGVKITDCYLESGTELFDDATKRHRVSQDFMVWHEEP